jgi:hypothetical protein
MTASDTQNFVLLVLVAVPPLCSVWLLRSASLGANASTVLGAAAAAYKDSPALLLNLLWLFHVDVTFYFISLAQVT